MGCENHESAIDAAVCEALRTDNNSSIDSAVRQALLGETQENLLRLNEAIEKNETSKRLIGIQEWEWFLQNFGLSEENPVQILEQVEFIQGGSQPDGILGPKTLKNIYRNHYAFNLESLPLFQKNRYMIYRDLQDYQPDRGRTPISIPNTFDARKYFGADSQGIFENMPGTFIVSDLYSKVPYIDTPNTLFIERIGGKMAIRLYNVAGELEIASYVSGGTREHKSPENYSGTASRTHRYHISSSYPEEGNQGASMFAATHIKGGVIWVHASNDMIDGHDHSHGCFRAGLYYADALQKYVDRYGPINLEIGNLY